MDCLDDGSVVFLNHSPGETSVDTPIVVRATASSYNVRVEGRSGEKLIARAHAPELGLEYALEKIRFLDLEMPMRWESGCSACHGIVRKATRPSGVGVAVSFDGRGYVSTGRAAHAMWFATRSDAHAFAEERTPPNCPIEVADGEVEPDDTEEHKRWSYLAHRRGHLLRTPVGPWLWGAAVDLRSEVATGVARLERGLDAADAIAHLPPAFGDRYDGTFLLRYLVALDDLCERLLTVQGPVPGCTAQEIALGAIVDSAEAIAQKSGDRAELDDFEEMAFEDLDFRWLYESDGLATIANQKVQAQLRPAYLGLHQWFTPFRDQVLPPAARTQHAPPPPRVKRLLARASRHI